MNHNILFSILISQFNITFISILVDISNNICKIFWILDIRKIINNLSQLNRNILLKELFEYKTIFIQCFSLFQGTTYIHLLFASLHLHSINLMKMNYLSWSGMNWDMLSIKMSSSGFIMIWSMGKMELQINSPIVWKFTHCFQN